MANKKSKKKHKSKQHGNSETEEQDIVESTAKDFDGAEEPERDTQNSELDLSSKLQKREHVADDSDSDNQEPKKKKKKKKPIATEEPGTDNKKNKKSNRQKKREKFAQRQAEIQAAAKDQLKSQCLNYLSQWKHDKSNWKFMKAKQVWLFKNKFSQTLVPDESWPLLMEYFESAKGNIRNMLLEDAKKVIKQMDDWSESQAKENEEETEKSEESAESHKPDDKVYKRARDLIQCLEE